MLRLQLHSSGDIQEEWQGAEVSQGGKHQWYWSTSLYHFWAKGLGNMGCFTRAWRDQTILWWCRFFPSFRNCTSCRRLHSCSDSWRRQHCHGSAECLAYNQVLPKINDGWEDEDVYEVPQWQRRATWENIIGKRSIRIRWPRCPWRVHESTLSVDHREHRKRLCFRPFRWFM